MSNKMTKEDARRIQSTQVDAHLTLKTTTMTDSRLTTQQAQGGKDMSSGSFPARAQAAGDKNANTGQGGNQGTGGQSGGNTSGNGNNTGNRGTK